MRKGDQRTFWTGVIVGLVVALIIHDYLITIGGVFIGGVFAGWIVGEKTGGKAGVYTGPLTAPVLTVILAVLGIEAAPGDPSRPRIDVLPLRARGQASSGRVPSARGG